MANIILNDRFKRTIKWIINQQIDLAKQYAINEQL